MELDTRYQMIEELRPLCEAAGLELRRSNDTHFQIMHEGVAVVDVWPSRNKYRRVTAHPDATALIGKASAAVQLAVNCANGKRPKPCSPKKAEVIQGTLRDQFAGEALSGWAAGRNKPMDADDSDPLAVARSCYRYADAMLVAREEKTPGNQPE